MMQGSPPTELPSIPGGWTVKRIDLFEQQFELTLPADPDAFLDDPETYRAFDQNGFTPYWPYLWPASLSMARSVLDSKWEAGEHMLEIGAGIGLPGLAALTRGLNVTFSDVCQQAVDLAVHNASQNGFPGTEGILLDWRHPPARTFPIICGCDVIYDPSHHAPILDLLDKMLTGDGVCWIGDPLRRDAAAFIENARTRGFDVNVNNKSPDRFQLIIITRGKA